MYSLLLVDDEKTIVDGLYHNIDWEETGFSGVHKAYDAKEALEILSRYRIDVVVSDICMPGMDGLEMCRRIRENWPMSKIIFLSGYREFDYARKAVELNVYQYLVKPVSYEDLQETVAGALAELKSDLEQRDLLDMARAKMQSMQMLLRERLLSNWLLQGALNPADDLEEIRGVGLEIGTHMYGFEVLIEMQGVREGVTGSELQMGIHTLAEGLCSGYTHLICIPVKRDRMLIAFLCEERDSAERLRAQCGNRLDAFQISLDKSLGCVVSIYLGRTVNVCDLHNAYAELLSAMRRERMAEGQIILADTQGDLDVFMLMEALKEKIASLNEAALRMWINRTFETVRASANRRDLHRLVITELTGALMCDSIARGIPDDELDGQCARLFAQDAHDVETDRLEAVCLDTVTGYIGFIRSRQDSERRKLVDAVRKLVEERMCDGITVSAVADALHYNPSYLSRLIKQETGQTLVDFIISIRIERACLLLAAGNRVQDVAFSVGYENFAHFSRTFKKKMGLSPRQYAG